MTREREVETGGRVLRASFGGVALARGPAPRRSLGSGKGTGFFGRELGGKGVGNASRISFQERGRPKLRELSLFIVPPLLHSLHTFPLPHLLLLLLLYVLSGFFLLSLTLSLYACTLAA
jgi:hypothetical protein